MMAESLGDLHVSTCIIKDDTAASLDYTRVKEEQKNSACLRQWEEHFHFCSHVMWKIIVL